MRKVYIVLTDTGTILSRLIKIYTRDEFAHASLAFDIDLNEMYSFGRLRPYNPFIGGFVHENVKWGTFHRFRKTKAAVYALMVTDEQYLKMKTIVEHIKQHHHDYKFNMLGLVAVGAHLNLKRNKRFYCAEFVKYLIDEAKIDLDLPIPTKPNDFQFVENLSLEYKGILHNYHLQNNNL